jgi:hypothetical protein
MIYLYIAAARFKSANVMVLSDSDDSGPAIDRAAFSRVVRRGRDIQAAWAVSLRRGTGPELGHQDSLGIDTASAFSHIAVNRIANPVFIYIYIYINIRLYIYIYIYIQGYVYKHICI